MYVRNGVHKKKVFVRYGSTVELKESIGHFEVAVETGSTLCCSELVGTHLCPKVLTSYKNHPGGNLDIKIKTMKLDVVGESPATKYI